MRILNILPYSPCPPHFGGALRIYHLLRQMVRAHTVTVIMYGTPTEGELVREAFDGRLNGVRTVAKPARLTGVHKRWAQARSLFGSGSATTQAFYSEAMQHTIDAVTAGQTFDLVQLETHPIGLFRVECPGVPSILDAQNVEYDNVRRMARASSSPLRRAFYGKEYRKLFNEEKAVYERQDALLLTSARDKSIMDGDFPGIPKFVIPNGVDSSFFRPSEESPGRHSLVFTGAMNYFPNVDGIVWFLNEIFPLIRAQVPDVRMSVVGGSPPKQLQSLASDSVTITGYVEDVRPFVHRASIYVVPLRMGGGTRLKVLEAMAMNKPVVTTSVGCEGIDVRDRETVLVADSPEKFADSVVELMCSDDLRRRLVARSGELVRAKYEWSVIGKCLDGVYESIMSSHSSTGAPVARGRHATLARS
jgi:sugar transferase (PEP-CTERM/EpsH1 system associated)